MEKRTITMLDIIKLTDWKEVKKSYKYFYGRKEVNPDTMEKIFNLLKTFKKRKHIDEDEEIEIYVGGIPIDESEDERWYDVHTNKYSLSFRKWRELVNIPISENTIRTNKFPEIITHFLWEITFYGFDESEILEQRKELMSTYKRSVKDLQKK